MVIYWKPGHRRPVWVGVYTEPDVQGRVPRGWCVRCGREIWDSGPLCTKCRVQ